MVVTISVFEDLKKTLGLGDHVKPLRMGHWTDVQMSIEMIKELGVDVYYVSPKSGKSPHSKKFEDGSFIDEWGCYWKKVEIANGHYLFEMVNAPLENASIEDLDKYVWPDPDDPLRYEGLYEEIKNIRENTDLAIIAKFAGPVFELGKYLRGYSQWLIDLMVNQEFAAKFMEKVCSIQKRINENCIKEVGKYVDVLRLSGEDFGMQDRPLIPPKVFKQVIKPYQKDLWMHAKELLLKYNPEAKVMLHSCGDVYPFIEDFIDCGVDVLDPIQPRAAEMDRFRLKKEFGDRLCFHGGIDIQHVLPFGTDEELEEEVITAIKALGVGGGYIVGPAHNVQSDVSAEKLLKMSDLIKKYGKYPIRL